MQPLVQKQFDLNTSSRGAWLEFAEHRQRVTKLLVGAKPARESPRLCVLGAGNANDLDLAELVRAFAEIHLVDLDASALQQGLERQQLQGAPQVTAHGGIDVTGKLTEISGWNPAMVIDPEQLAACVDAPSANLATSLPGPFDVVASTCLLSQLMLSIHAAVGEQHPRFLELLQAVRLGHLRLLANLTRPGGTLVLITDIVSSESCAELTSIPAAQLQGLLVRLISQRNFFHGVNPGIIGSILQTDAVLQTQLTGLSASSPWRWNLGQRTYAVCAFVAQRR